jgi:hypothetical protein
MPRSKLVAIVQVVILLPVLVRFLVAPLDFSALGLWVLVVGFAVLTVPLGLWQFAKHPEQRTWASVVMALPVLCVILPLVVSALEIGPVPMPLAIGVAVLVGLAAWAAALAGHGLRRASGPWPGDRAMTIALVLCLAAVALPFVAVALSGWPQAPGAGFDALLVHSVVAAPAAGLVSMHALVHAAVGIRRNRSARGGPAVRVLLALATLALAALLVLLVAALITNPG